VCSNQFLVKPMVTMGGVSNDFVLLMTRFHSGATFSPLDPLCQVKVTGPI